MKFLADENIASAVISTLTKNGYDVKTIINSRLQGCSDTQLIRISLLEKRIILTHDKDFISLFETQQSLFTVIVIRLATVSPKRVKQVILEFLDAYGQENLTHRLVIIEEFGVRMIEK